MKIQLTWKIQSTDANNDKDFWDFLTKTLNSYDKNCNTLATNIKIENLIKKHDGKKSQMKIL